MNSWNKLASEQPTKNQTRTPTPILMKKKKKQKESHHSVDLMFQTTLIL